MMARKLDNYMYHIGLACLAAMVVATLALMLL